METEDTSPKNNGHGGRLPKKGHTRARGQSLAPSHASPPLDASKAKPTGEAQGFPPFRGLWMMPRLRYRWPVDWRECGWGPRPISLWRLCLSKIRKLVSRWAGPPNLRMRGRRGKDGQSWPFQMQAHKSKRPDSAHLTLTQLQIAPNNSDTSRIVLPGCPQIPGESGNPKPLNQLKS